MSHVKLFFVNMHCSPKFVNELFKKYIAYDHIISTILNGIIFFSNCLTCNHVRSLLFE